MKSRIFKYPITTTGEATLPGMGEAARAQVPSGAELLDVQVEPDGTIVCWAVVDAELPCDERFRFCLFRTGDRISAGKHLAHRATLRHEGEVIHVFEYVRTAVKVRPPPYGLPEPDPKPEPERPHS